MNQRAAIWRRLAVIALLSGCSDEPAPTSMATAEAASPSAGAAATDTQTQPSAASSQSAAAAGSSGASAAEPDTAASAAPASDARDSSAPAADSGEGASAAAGSGGDAGAMPVDSAEPDPSPGCAGGSLMPGESTQMLQSGGSEHVYVQHIPPGYDGKTPLPLVLDLHGGSYDGPRWVDASGFKQLGDTENFITLFPSGADNSWLATEPDSADGKFLRDLIEEIGKQGCIDRKRVYSTGCSMGGAMSFWLGCFASDLVAAIAPMCGTPFFSLMDCKPERPLSVMLTMGETDGLNCWDGMPGSVGNPCAKEVQSAFKEIDSCPGDFKSTYEGVCETYEQCAEGTEVTICKSDTGHGVYTATNIAVTEESWKFLKRFHLP